MAGLKRNPQISAALLPWYDRNRRSLPWRRENPDPYAVWLSEIMLQQTTVKAVIPYFQKFLNLWPDVRALAQAPTAEIMSAWAGLGYYSRARNLQASAKAVAEDFQGAFPAAEEDLRQLPGIGPYTAAAISAIAFQRRAVVVDGNVERVVARLFALQTALPAAKPEIRALTDTITPDTRTGDFAQAMMDLGATVCTPRSPKCDICPLSRHCAARSHDPASFPRKAAKKARPQRQGAAFFITRADGAILVRTRSDKGLLGGMTELPTTDWTPDFRFELGQAPVAANYGLCGSVRQVFTHFELQLDIYAARVENAPPPPSYRWLQKVDMEKEAWPSVMRKALALGQHHER